MKRSFLFISAVGCGGSLPSFRLPSRRDGRAPKVRQCGGILFRLEGRRRWQVCRPAPRAPPLPQSSVHVCPSASPALVDFCFCCKDRASLLPAQKIAPWVRSDSRNEAAGRTKLSISSAFSAPRFFLSPPPFFAKMPRPGGGMADKGRENRLPRKRSCPVEAAVGAAPWRRSAVPEPTGRRDGEARVAGRKDVYNFGARMVLPRKTYGFIARKVWSCPARGMVWRGETIRSANPLAHNELRGRAGRPRGGEDFLRFRELGRTARVWMMG